MLRLWLLVRNVTVEKKNTAVGGLRRSVCMGGSALEPDLSIFHWVLHCNPWSRLKPPLLPTALVHTVECSGLRVPLSSQEDNGWADAGTHACTSTYNVFFPFHPVCFGHLSWGCGPGGHGNAGIEQGLSFPVSVVSYLWRKRERERTTAHIIARAE